MRFQCYVPRYSAEKEQLHKATSQQTTVPFLWHSTEQAVLVLIYLLSIFCAMVLMWASAATSAAKLRVQRFKERHLDFKLPVINLAAPLIQASNVDFQSLILDCCIKLRKFYSTNQEHFFDLWLIVFCSTDRIDFVSAPTKRSRSSIIAAFLLRRYILARSAPITEKISNQFLAWTRYASFAFKRVEYILHPIRWVLFSNMSFRLDSISPYLFCHSKQVVTKRFKLNSLRYARFCSSFNSWNRVKDLVRVTTSAAAELEETTIVDWKLFSSRSAHVIHNIIAYATVSLRQTRRDPANRG